MKVGVMITTIFLTSLLILTALIALTRLIGISSAILDYSMLIISSLSCFLNSEFRQIHFIKKLIWVVINLYLLYFSFFWILWVLFNQAI
jgi:hypothetical protein